MVDKSVRKLDDVSIKASTVESRDTAGDYYHLWQLIFLFNINFILIKI